jgi:hypothetical protein
MDDRYERALVGTALGLAVAVVAAGHAAAPPLAADVAPPGVWTLASVDGAPAPWPGATVQLGIADDGVTVLVDTGCERFIAVASNVDAAPALEPGPSSAPACDGDRAAAEAAVAPVLTDVDAIDVVAGRLRIRGAGRVLVYAPEWEPAPAGIPGVPRLGSSDRLDPSRFAAALDASAANGAHWVRDPVQVALLFVDEASAARTTIVRDGPAEGAATTVRFWLDGRLDDAAPARWFEVRLERSGEGVWRIVSARRASLCSRGDVTDVLVAGLCP